MLMQSEDKDKKRRFIDPTVGLFVSLYFILVAFFIVMNAISNQETARSVAVMESLEDAFERPYEQKAQAPGLIPPGRHMATDDAFIEEAGTLLAAWLAPVRGLPSDGGNDMAFEIKASRLFYMDDSRLSEQAPRIFSELATLVSSAPPGMRREIVFLFGQNGPAGSHALRRADALAKAMELSSVPARSLAVGLDRHMSGRLIRLEMRSVFEDGVGGVTAS